MKKSIHTNIPPGFSNAFPGKNMCTTEKRLRFYTDEELSNRKTKMKKHLSNIKNPNLKKRIRFELKIINTLLS